MGSDPAIYPPAVIFSFSVTAPSGRVAEIVIAVAVASLNIFFFMHVKQVNLTIHEAGT